MMGTRWILLSLLLSNIGCAMAKEDHHDRPDNIVLSFDYQGWGLSGGLNGFAIYGDGTYALKLTNLTSTSGLGDGAGLYRGSLGPDELVLKAKLTAILCDNPHIGDTPMVSPGFISAYSAICPAGGKVSGSVDGQAKLPEGAEPLMSTFGKLAQSMYKNAAEREVKLDVDYDIESKLGGFLVTMRFINNGKKIIAIKSPATWDGGVPHYIPIGTSASLQAGDFEVVLGGRDMLNAKDYADDVIRIPPGEFRKAEFFAVPEGKATKGKHPSGGRVFTEGLEPKVLATALDFFVVTREREVPRDYPSTPKEWEAYESRHRQYDVAASVGKPIPEDGYYRAGAFITDAMRPADEVVGRFVTRLRKGDVAPDVTREVDAKGHMFPASSKHATWTWAADYSSVVETQPRQPCPKSGVWFARVPSEVPNSAYFQRDTMVTVKYGERMPTVGLADPAAEDRVRWLWIRPIE